MAIIKIWNISDSHAKHNELNIPKADMVIHAGDSTHDRITYNFNETMSFFNWFDVINFDKKILIAGNHDGSLQSKEVIPPDYYIQDEMTKYKKIKIYGTPWTPEYGTWSFMLSKEKEIEWARKIPPCDILVTHGPPKFILDSVFKGNNYTHCGSLELYHRVNRIKPKLHIFGHVHSSVNNKYPANNGVYFNGNTWFINASCCSDGVGVPLTSHGWIVEMDEETKEIIKIYRNEQT